MRKITLLLMLIFAINCTIAQKNKKMDLLIFTKTNGFRHDAIPAAKISFEKLAKENKWKIEFSEDSTVFTSQNLAKFNVVVFLLTTGDILNDEQQLAFQKFIQAGGGFVAVHTGTDTEYKWPWYGELVGAYFIGHPPTQSANLIIEDRTHLSTMHMDKDTILWKDEFYSFNKNPRQNVKVLVSLDESSFNVSDQAFLKEKKLIMGDHPLVWYHEFDGGRSFHTALGHMPELYEMTFMKKHLTGAVNWAGKVN